MDKILLWDSNPGFRQALFRILSLNGYKPVALENPAQLSRALELEKPELTILEGDWGQGSRINLTQAGLSFGSDGELSVILPSFDVSRSGDHEASGIVLKKLRKPFGSAELFTGIRSAFKLKARIESVPLPWEEYFVFRRLRSRDELLTALQLRYEVYREVGFISPSSSQLELDQHDPKSIIFGSFFHQNGASQLVGALRIIRNDNNGPHLQELKDIMLEREITPPGATAYTVNSLPACQTFNISAEALPGFHPGFGSTLSACGEPVSSEVCELSRLVIQKEFRQSRYGIERRLFELIVVDCYAEEPKRNWFVIAVHPSKRAKFERFGFTKLDDFGVKAYTGLAKPAILMVLDLQQYLLTPNPFTAELDLNTLLYRVNGSLLSNLQKEELPVEKMAG